METKDYETHIKITKQELLKGYYITTEEIEKALSYLIFCTQLYCKKGGEKDLW